MTNLMKRILFLSLFLMGIINFCLAQDIEKQTFIYSIKGNDTLRLDKYDIPSITESKPCIIFMFGGAFLRGSRDDAYNTAYLRKLAENGYIAIAIDYRLGLKSAKEKGVGEAMDIIDVLENTINMAVEDLFDATSFAYKNAEQWNLNKDLIIANGSSAGAVSVLQAEYAICTNHELRKKLPDNFNYAGVIAFAGAIFSRNGDLNWTQKPAPIQMFHGNADDAVPYDKVEMFNLGLYGSKHIAKQLKELKSPYYFYNVTNVAHHMASTPMTENIEEIRSFIDKYIIRKKPYMIELDRDEIGLPELKKDFEIMDYFKTNDYM